VSRPENRRDHACPWIASSRSGDPARGPAWAEAPAGSRWLGTHLRDEQVAENWVVCWPGLGRANPADDRLVQARLYRPRFQPQHLLLHWGDGDGTAQDARTGLGRRSSSETEGHLWDNRPGNGSRPQEDVEDEIGHPLARADALGLVERPVDAEVDAA